MDESFLDKKKYDRSFWFYIIVCAGIWSIRFLHDVSDDQSNASWDTSHAMNQNICTFSLSLNKVITVFKEDWDVAWFMINNWNIQIFNMFWYFLWQVLSLYCCNDSSNIMFWDNLWITFQCVRVTSCLNVANKNSTTTILLRHYTADIFSKCSVWVHHFLSL